MSTTDPYFADLAERVGLRERDLAPDLPYTGPSQVVYSERVEELERIVAEGKEAQAQIDAIELWPAASAALGVEQV